MKRERIVVVPWAPRPLIAPEDGHYQSDGVDQFIDDLLGNVETQPAWFDVALLAGGAGVVVGSVAGANSPDLVFTGGVAGVVGGAALVRTAWRERRRRRRRRRATTAMTHGLPLVASHPDTQALISAYQRVLDAAAHAGVPDLAHEAAAAAHLAVMETATMLNGAPPGGAPEEEYVRQRTQAVEALLVALEDPRVAGELLQANQEATRLSHFSR